MRRGLISLLLCCPGLLAGCATGRAQPPAPAPNPVFHNASFRWSVQPPTGWRATATGGNADPVTSPSVTFIPPGAGRSNDEYLAVRHCHSPEECLPPDAAATGATAPAGAGRAEYAAERQAAPGRRLREVHTIVRAGGRIFDLVLSRPVAGGQEAEAHYPAFRDSFQIQP